MRGRDDDLGTGDTVAEVVSVSGPNARTASADPSNDADLGRGESVGEYVIEDVIGRGGFGTVYAANQPVIGKRVAIKLLSRKYSADTEMVSRFAAEARAVNQIKHRHIIDIFSFGQLSDGRQYYVMEHLDGEPLDTYLAANGPLTLAQALPILRAVARALDAAHAKGVAHRDLKPENVFLSRDDEGNLFPKLLDFGIAKLSNTEASISHKTNTGVPLGTPYYMSPEQCRGQNVDFRTDIYSFGVMTYRLLTGVYPFEGGMIDILHHQMYDEPPAPSSHNAALGSTVDDAIAWMMRKEAAQRPESVIRAVVALQGETPTPMLTPSMVELAATLRPRRRWLAPTIGLVVLGAAGIVAFMLTRGPEESDSPPDRRKDGLGNLPVVDAAVLVGIDAPTVVVDAAEPSKFVTVTVAGVPKGTEVLLAGKVIATAPGRVELERSGRVVVLTLRADRYDLERVEVTPDKDQPLPVTLKKARDRSTPAPVDDNALLPLGHDAFEKPKKP